MKNPEVHCPQQATHLIFLSANLLLGEANFADYWDWHPHCRASPWRGRLPHAKTLKFSVGIRIHFLKTRNTRKTKAGAFLVIKNNLNNSTNSIRIPVVTGMRMQY